MPSREEQVVMSISEAEIAAAETLQGSIRALLLQLGGMDREAKLSALFGAATVIIEGGFAPADRLQVLHLLLAPTIHDWSVAAAVDQAKGATKQ